MICVGNRAGISGSKLDSSIMKNMGHLDGFISAPK